MPAGAICLGFDMIGSRSFPHWGRDEMAAAVRSLRDSQTIDAWLPFAQVNGDEIWGIVADGQSLLAALRLLLVENGHFRAGIGFGYTEVNSAFYPRDDGYELAKVALNQWAKKSGQLVEVAAADREAAKTLGRQLRQLVDGWKRGESPDERAALATTALLSSAR